MSIAHKKVAEKIEARLASKTELNTEMLSTLKRSDEYRNFKIGLTNELIKAAAVVARRGKVKRLSDATINETINSFTDHFIAAFEFEAIKRTESDLDRIAREEKAQYQKDIEDTLDGNSSGVFEELGVEIVDKTQDISEEENG